MYSAESIAQGTHACVPLLSAQMFVTASFVTRYLFCKQLINKNVVPMGFHISTPGFLDLCHKNNQEKNANF